MMSPGACVQRGPEQPAEVVRHEERRDGDRDRVVEHLRPGGEERPQLVEGVAREATRSRRPPGTSRWPRRRSRRSGRRSRPRSRTRPGSARARRRRPGRARSRSRSRRCRRPSRRAALPCRSCLTRAVRCWVRRGQPRGGSVPARALRRRHAWARGRPAEAGCMQNPMHRSRAGRNRPYDPDEPGVERHRRYSAMETSRRENYDSGEDFVLEYGELRFTFNEADFAERCEQAALKLGFVGGRLGEEELEDLVNLAVNGEIIDPASALGRARQRLLAGARRPGRALAGALAAPARVPRRLARPARQGGRAERRVRRADRQLRLRAAARPGVRSRAASRSSSRPSPPGAGSPTGASSPLGARSRRGVAQRVERRARALRDRLARRPRRRAAPARSVPLAARSRIGWRPVDGQRRRRARSRCVSPPNGLRGRRDHGQRAAVAQVARGRERLARGLRLQPVERRRSARRRRRRARRRAWRRRARARPPAPARRPRRRS